mmetsp:Transcript_18013/g.17194  ORF Transcript_18013/g.17194 Transcript_18013/m.17194 type:complete len:224 (-) Transcript_18013:382-1053(-)
MISSRASFYAAVAALLSLQASAWWSTGHMLAARIAYDKLMEESPEVVDRANGALSHIASFTSLERDHPFVECATFGDAIKGAGWYDTSYWHFVDNPIFDGYTDEKWYPSEYNATWVLGELISALKYARADAPPTLQSGYVDYALGDSFNIRMFIHIAADIHQPLHATSRYAPNHQEGDRGGNSYSIDGDYGISQLHALWDSVVYAYHDDLSLPLSDSNWDYLG